MSVEKDQKKLREKLKEAKKEATHRAKKKHCFYRVNSLQIKSGI